ncbi:MAG: YfhO family protein [Candidatus Levybacteria bacterium]|nr:YfhO family protein [Candidatus Levybacteria bacterium]
MKFFQIVKEKIWLIFLVVIPLLFFYQTIFFGRIPFPGDLLVGEYNPYNSYPFLGYVPGSYPNKAQNFDVIELLYPAKFLSIESFKNFQLPLWNPYNFSGSPHLASLQSGSLYPLNLIFFILPFVYAWSFYIWLQFILAGIFTYILLRELRIGSVGSFFGALSFTFSSFFVVWIEYGNIGHSILWLPLLIWLSLRFVKKPTLGTYFIMIAGLTSSILAGYIQTSFYLFIFLMFFTLFNIIFLNEKDRLRKIVIMLPIFVFPVFLSAAQLIPMLELFNSSSRSSYMISSMINSLIPKFHIITLFVPDFFGNPATRNYWLEGTYIERVSYIGILPLLFAIYSVLKRQKPTVLFFASSSLVILLLTFDNIISRTFYSLNLPFVSTAVPTRIMYLFCFSTSILAAFGFDLFEKNKKRDNTFIISLFASGLIFISLWLYVLLAPDFFKNESLTTNLAISKRNLILPTMILGVGSVLALGLYKLKNFKKYILLALLLLTVFDLFYFFQKITPFSPSQSVYPTTEVMSYLKSVQGIDRSWGYGSGYIESNIQTYEKIYSSDGYDALHLKRYGELLSTSDDGNISENIARSEAELKRGYGQNDLRDNSFRQRLMNLLGVKYILHKVDSEVSSHDFQTFDKEIYRLIWNKDKWHLYENKEVLERISLFGDYIVEKEDKNIIRKIHDPNFNLSETLILEENLPEAFNIVKDKNATVKVKRYANNNILVDTRSFEDSLLFISDSYFPGWKVKIDNNESKIYRANYTFRAVPVPMGEHNVSFYYSPDSFDLGLKVSGITLLILLLIMVLVFLKTKALNKK